MQLLYLLEFRPGEEQESIADYWSRFRGAREVERYARRLVEGVLRHRERIDEILRACMVRWSLERLSRVDLNILRIATFEICLEEDVPAKVAINEAIEIAKSFSDRNAAAFINGVLDRVLRQYDGGGLEATERRNHG